MIYLWILLSIWGATATFFLLFLVFAACMEAKRAGRTIPLFSKVIIGPAILFGALLDVAWNYTLGSLLFLQFPDVDEPGFPAYTFTHRLQQQKGEFTWRGVIARWFAKQLNVFDPGHV
jgi:hypothetical protein